jgi:hypothetical protein
VRTMAAELARAPFAMAAGEIDFAGYTFSRIHHFTDEFVARRSLKTVVSTLKLEVCRADSGRQQADARESLGNTRQRPSADFDPARFEMDGKHHLKLIDTDAS